MYYKVSTKYHEHEYINYTKFELLEHIFQVLILLLVGSMTFALEDFYNPYGNPYGLSNDGMDLPYSPRYR